MNACPDPDEFDEFDSWDDCDVPAFDADEDCLPELDDEPPPEHGDFDFEDFDELQ